MLAACFFFKCEEELSRQKGEGDRERDREVQGGGLEREGEGGGRCLLESLESRGDMRSQRQTRAWPCMKPLTTAGKSKKIVCVCRSFQRRSYTRF